MTATVVIGQTGAAVTAGGGAIVASIDNAVVVVTAGGGAIITASTDHATVVAVAGAAVVVSAGSAAGGLGYIPVVDITITEDGPIDMPTLFAPITVVRLLGSGVGENVTALTNYALSSGEWAALAALAAGVVVVPTTYNGHYYETQTTGTAGSTEPVWPVNGGTVNDGTLTWQDMGTWPLSVTLDEPIPPLGRELWMVAAAGGDPIMLAAAEQVSEATPIILRFWPGGEWNLPVADG